MNQIRIGAFICERRRAKGWTQNQLAQKLGITDKAISKWETGKSMPDLSLFMPLCTLLDISLNELFAGECISDEKIKEKTDEVLMDVITNWLGHDQCQAEESDTISESILEVQNVSRIYKTDTHTVFAVNNVSFQIPPGSFVGIMGASGSGKSTLLICLFCIPPLNRKLNLLLPAGLHNALLKYAGGFCLCALLFCLCYFRILFAMGRQYK